MACQKDTGHNQEIQVLDLALISQSVTCPFQKVAEICYSAKLTFYNSIT